MRVTVCSCRKVPRKIDVIGMPGKIGARDVYTPVFLNLACNTHAHRNKRGFGAATANENARNFLTSWYNNVWSFCKLTVLRKVRKRWLWRVLLRTTSNQQAGRDERDNSGTSGASHGQTPAYL